MIVPRSLRGAAALCVLLSSHALAQPATEPAPGRDATAFTRLEATSTYTNGLRAGTRSRVAIDPSGAIELELVAADGVSRSARNEATPEQLEAVLSAFQQARFTELPAAIFDPSEIVSVGSVRLEAQLPDGAAHRVEAGLGLYAGFAGRLRPLVDALGALEARLEPQALSGFRSITLTTRYTAGPRAGTTSVLQLGASRRARFALDAGDTGIVPIAAEASPAEQERVIAGFAAAKVGSIPDGFIFDPRELLAVGEVELEVVLADGSHKSISAVMGLYGKHDLRGLIAALQAIASRFEAGSLSVPASGGLAGAVGH